MSTVDSSGGKQICKRAWTVLFAKGVPLGGTFRATDSIFQCIEELRPDRDEAVFVELRIAHGQHGARKIDIAHREVHCISQPAIQQDSVEIEGEDAGSMAAADRDTRRWNTDWVSASAARALNSVP